MTRALLLVALTLCACSSGGPGTAGFTGSGTESGNMGRLCDTLCGWYARCGEPQTNCSSECNGDTAKYAGKWSATFVNTTATCFETLACDQNDDRCVANFAAVDPAYPNIPEVQSCLSKRSECTSSAPFSDDYCHSLTALTAAARAEASACLSRACAEVSACLRNAGAFTY